MCEECVRPGSGACWLSSPRWKEATPQLSPVSIIILSNASLCTAVTSYDPPYAAEEPDVLVFHTTLNNSLPPCLWATLNVGLTHLLVACPPPKLNGRQFPWKPPVKVPPPSLSWRQHLVSVSCRWTQKQGGCVYVFKHSHICRVVMHCVFKGLRV